MQEKRREEKKKKKRRWYPPPIRISVTLDKTPLGNAHFHLFGQGEKLLRHEEDLIRCEAQWGVDKVREPGGGEDVVQPLAQVLQVILCGGGFERGEVDDGEGGEGRCHFFPLLFLFELILMPCVIIISN